MGDEYTLSYILNGKHYGVAFEVDKGCEYRLSVCMLPGMMVELCDMEEDRMECSEIQLLSHAEGNGDGARCAAVMWKYRAYFIAVIVGIIGILITWYNASR